MSSQYIQEGASIDYTPGADTSAGAVVVQGDLVGITKRDIKSGQLGALAVEGVFEIRKATGAISVGAKVYWDVDGDPVVGAAGSGAVVTAASGNKYLGHAIAAAASGDSIVRVRLSQ